MKKVVLMAVCSSVLLSSCGTYTGTGAYIGGGIGSVLGSAIGGLNDGPRGSDLGTIIGMAGGAVIGAAVGNAADRAQQKDYDIYEIDKASRNQSAQQQNESNQDVTDESGFDESNSGDDRIYDFNGTDYNGSYSAQEPVQTTPKQSSVDEIVESYSYTPNLEIRNARFVDDNQDGKLNSGELCKLIFEVYNNGSKTIYDVVPTVIDATANKHIWISPSIHVEKINPGKGIRYTAVVKADKKLKDGDVKICASVVQGNTSISKVSEFNIPTKR